MAFRLNWGTPPAFWALRAPALAWSSAGSPGFARPASYRGANKLARVRKDMGQTGRMRASYRGPNKLARVRKDTGQTGRSDARRGVAEQTGTAGFCVFLRFFLPTSRQSRPPTSYNVCISPCVGRVSDPPPGFRRCRSKLLIRCCVRALRGRGKKAPPPLT